MIGIPVIAPLPLMKPCNDATGIQFGFFSKKQSSVILILYFNSPKMSDEFAGTGSVPISHIKVPLPPKVGLKYKLFGVGNGE